MISYLRGKLVLSQGSQLTVETGGLGFEVTCSKSVIDRCPEIGSTLELFLFPHFKTDGMSFYGFANPFERSMFLSLLKVDTVGPKSALNVLGAAPLKNLTEMINDGDKDSLSELPKISKKLAETIVVKLKGKLDDLLGSLGGVTESTTTESRPKKGEAQSALSHLGYRAADIDRALSKLPQEAWKSGFEEVIRQALVELSN